MSVAIDNHTLMRDARIRLLTGEAARGGTVEEAISGWLEELRSMPYRDYLRSLAWSDTRHEALQRAAERCQLCNSQQRLEVHHRTYERRGAELLSDLIVLCRQCHGRHHGKLVAPAPEPVAAPGLDDLPSLAEAHRILGQPAGYTLRWGNPR